MSTHMMTREMLRLFVMLKECIGNRNYGSKTHYAIMYNIDLFILKELASVCLIIQIKGLV